MAANTIFLDACERHDERLASGIFSPGHLLDIDSDGKVLKHAVEGGRALWLAKEDSLQGRTITDAYASGELARLGIPYRGTKVRARIAAGAVAIAKGDELISDGAGGLKKRLIPSGVMFAAAASSTALNTHTTITPFDVSYTIPANSLRVGDVLKINATVLFPNASNSTETVLITLKIGSVVVTVAGVNATTGLDNAAGDIARIEAYVHVRAIGASGSILAFGTNAIGAPYTVTDKPFYLAATALATNATAAVTVNQTCSGSHANTGGQLVELTVENQRRDVDLFVADEAVDNSAGVAEAFVKCVSLGA